MGAPAREPWTLCRRGKPLTVEPGRRLSGIHQQLPRMLMREHRLWHTVLLMTLSGGAPAGLAGQAPHASCTYATCSLRLEEGRLLRGAHQVVGRTTLTGMPRLSALVVTDSAQAYARAFDHAYPRSRWLAITGGALLGLGVGIALDRVDAPERGLVLALGVTGVATGAVAWHFDRRAMRALSRALWWHNAQFVGPAGGA